MAEIKDFYESGKGDRLIDPLLFPEEIKQFLTCEKRILETLADSFDLLVEVGSMYGRYPKWAVENGKYYLGIDIVQRYIETGRKIILDLQLNPDKCRFVLGGAENITDLVKPREWNVKLRKCLLFFPFNSFGNMEDPLVIVKGIKKSGLPFLISTYGTSQETNVCREQYYRDCGYSEIVSLQDEKGVRFVSPDGLSTIAYHPDYLQEIFTIASLKVAIVHFSQIAVAFTLPELAKKIMPITF
ncbi:hypothetical protein KJ632_01195 [Patescibacteria group bacterium]|nr:hypothetical protein [Patescibacteria group bacterium]